MTTPKQKKRFCTEYYSRYGVTHPSYIVVRIAGHHIQNRASKYFSGRLIDIGCGTKAKHYLVGEFVREHFGLDHKSCLHDQSNINLFGTAYALPFSNNSFDCQLSTAVLEHLEEPSKALHEAYRILKPGGYGLYTLPLTYHFHYEPLDFFLYTKYGLEHLFRSVGFEIVEIDALSGFWVTFATLFNHYLQRFKLGILKYPINTLIIMNNLIIGRMDRGSLRDERFTWAYLAIVRKPTGNQNLH